MKNASLVLNIVLLAAVGVLFYLHFSKGSTEQSQHGADSSMIGDLKIAYIRADTVLKHYEYFKVTRAQLEQKKTKLEQELRDRAQSLQSEYERYQRTVNTMTLSEVRVAEENINKRQQNLQVFQQSAEQQLMTEDAKIGDELYKRLTAYLADYGREKGLQLVLKFDPTSDVLFGHEILDISQDVIKGLNEAYALEKKSTSKPVADTTRAK